MKKYEVLLFDLDDTLIDNIENVRYAYKNMLKTVGKDYTEEDFFKWWKLDNQFWIDFHNDKIEIPSEFNSDKDLLLKYLRSLRYVLHFNGEISIEEAFDINEIFLNDLNEVVVPIDGAFETLEYLYDKYRLVIATNGPILAVETKLKKIDCLQFIDSIFSTDMADNAAAKPDKDFFRQLKDYLNFYDDNKILIIGDSLHSDVLGGMNCGIDTCWFNRKNDILLDKYKPTMTITNLKQLIKKL